LRLSLCSWWGGLLQLSSLLSKLHKGFSKQTLVNPKMCSPFVSL
jgi:hypothetical protein